jgi:hypothetical protein
MLNSVFIITKKSESMQMIQRMKYFTGYVPKIKFPNRHQNITFSGKKIQLTNREALNQAMREEMERD